MAGIAEKEQGIEIHGKLIHMQTNTFNCHNNQPHFVTLFVLLSLLTRKIFFSKGIFFFFKLKKVTGF